MTPREFCACGRSEPLKAAVHGALLATAAVCVAYNATALAFRRERHLAVNAGIYGLLVAFEAKKIWHHLREQ